MPDFLDAQHQRWLEVAEQLTSELVMLAGQAGADGDSELAVTQFGRPRKPRVCSA